MSGVFKINNAINDKIDKVNQMGKWNVFILTMILTFSLAPFAHAQTVFESAGSMTNSFFSQVNGQSGSSTEPDHQYREVNGLPDDQKAALQKLVVQQAMIWGDTILEGDFEAAGDTRIDRVQGVYSGETLLGYRVTFSESAWATGKCGYDPRDKTTLSACMPGRISESMFVSVDFKEGQRDERDFAHFLN